MFRRRLITTCVTVLAVLSAAAGYWGYRLYRVVDVTRSWHDEVRYLVESGESIGTAPASDALSDGYLDAVLGDNPELLRELKTLIKKGVDDAPTLNLGEVAALNITYNLDENGSNVNVAAHIAGGFPVESNSRKPGFHRDGYFQNLTDSQLYSFGNQQIQFLGRDFIFFAEDSNKSNHQDMVDSIFSGNILPLADSLSNTMYHTTVFPNPDRVLPPQLRHHVQTVISKGKMSQEDGDWDIILITESPESARYVRSVLNDMKRTAEVTLASVLGGQDVVSEWGGDQYVWWAKSMLSMAKRSKVEQVGAIIRVRTQFKRHMVNAALKTVERAMHDYRAIRETYGESDPRMAKAFARADRMEARGRREKAKGERMLKYWSDEHKDGPDWPIPAKETGLTGSVQTDEQ